MVWNTPSMPPGPNDHMLRVTLQEMDVLGLMEQFPKLTRTEICDVVARDGPFRQRVEEELARLSEIKR